MLSIEPCNLGPHQITPWSCQTHLSDAQ